MRASSPEVLYDNSTPGGLVYCNQSIRSPLYIKKRKIATLQKKFLRVWISVFAGMTERRRTHNSIPIPAPHSIPASPSIPAKAGISLLSNCKKTVRCVRCPPRLTGRFPLSREWGEEGQRQLLPFRRKPESLRRSRIRRQATIAMFRFAENSRCRENEDSGFRRNGIFFFLSSIPPPLPFPPPFPFPPLFHSRPSFHSSPLLPFLRRQESLPGVSGKFCEAEWSACAECGYPPQRFPFSREWRNRRGFLFSGLLRDSRGFLLIGRPDSRLSVFLCLSHVPKACFVSIQHADKPNQRRQHDSHYRRKGNKKDKN